MQENIKPSIDGLFTVKAAAAVLNLREWWIRRALKAGHIPHYTPFNSRKLVKLSEVVEFIERARHGGSL